MHRHNPKRFQISLKWSISIIIVFTAGLVMLSTQIPWSIFSSDKTEELINQINDEIVNSVTRETGELFEEAVNVQRTVREIFTSGIVSPYDEEAREPFYLSLLKNNRDFSWVSFGWTDGDFFGAQRGENETLRFYERDWDPERQTTNQLIRQYSVTNDDLLTLIDVETSQRVYDATQRSWYRRSEGTPDDIVTDVYLFSASQKPGINTAVRLLDDDGDLIGIISIAIELDSISTFIDQLDISEHGEVFIIDSQEQLIAFSDQEQLTNVNEETNAMKLRLLEESDNFMLQIAHASLMTNERGLIGAAISSQYTRFTPEGSNDAFFIAIRELETSDLVSRLGWYIGTVIPENDFLSDIRRNIIQLTAVIVAIVLLCLVFILLFTQRFIVHPIQRIVEQAGHIRRLDLEKVSLPLSPIRDISLLSDSMHSMISGLTSFRKYVPAELVQLLILQGREARLGSEHRDMTIFFSDITQFTRLTEVLGTELALYLTSYFNGLSTAITEEAGVIDKYIGDAILAFWGAPIPQEDHALRACRAALKCQLFLHTLRREWHSSGKELLYCRIGINSGEVLVGNFGWDQRMDYTVLGDPVNTANRLETLNKIYGTQILVGQATYETIKDEMICRKLDRVVLYGKIRSEDIYELVATKEEADGQYRWVPLFEQGLKYYRARNWRAAMDSFNEAYESREQRDIPSALFIKRCRYLAEQRLPEDWDGTFVAQRK